MIPEPVDDGQPDPPVLRFGVRPLSSSWEVYDRDTGQRVQRPDDPDGYRRAVGELFSMSNVDEPWHNDWNACHEAAKARAAELNEANGNRERRPR